MTDRPMNMLRTFLFLVVLSFAAACSCGPKPCTAGQQGCACKTGNMCDDGLACGADNMCSAVATVGVHVDPAARGCEVVFTEPSGTNVAQVSFKNGLKGAWVRESPKVAVTFVAGADSTIADGSIELGLGGAGAAVTVLSGSCVDSNGSRLPGTTVSIK